MFFIPLGTRRRQQAIVKDCTLVLREGSTLSKADNNCSLLVLGDVHDGLVYVCDHAGLHAIALQDSSLDSVSLVDEIRYLCQAQLWGPLVSLLHAMVAGDCSSTEPLSSEKSTLLRCFVDDSISSAGTRACLTQLVRSH